MAQAMTGLFGPSADEVRLAIEQQGQDFDMQRAQMPAGRGAVALASQAGRMVGDVAQGLGGYQDPRVQSAQLMQEAAQEVDSQGFSLLEDPQAYYKAAYSSLMKRGLTAEAAHVRDLALNEQATQSKMALESAQAYKALQPEYGATRNGMIYGKNTGEVVREGTPSDPKSQIVSLYPPGTVRKGEVAPKTFDMSNPEKRQEALQLMSEGYIDDNALPGPEGKGQNITVQASFDKEGGKLAAQRDDEYFRNADSAISIKKSLANIGASLESGTTTFGTMADARASVARAVTTFAPSYADSINRLTGVDPVTFDVVEKANKGILGEMAKNLTGGGRITNMALQTMEKAGPAVWLTNEGMNVVRKVLDKEADYKIDLAKYVATLPGEDPNRESKILQWKSDQIGNSKYDLTQEDLKQAKGLAERSRKIRDLGNGAAPLPTLTTPEGDLRVNEKLITPDKIYMMEGKFYKVVPSQSRRGRFDVQEVKI